MIPQRIASMENGGLFYVRRLSRYNIPERINYLDGEFFFWKFGGDCVWVLIAIVWMVGIAWQRSSVRNSLD
jgi:hypothetical protein